MKVNKDIVDNAGGCFVILQVSMGIVCKDINPFFVKRFEGLFLTLNLRFLFKLNVRLHEIILAAKLETLYYFNINALLRMKLLMLLPINSIDDLV